MYSIFMGQFFHASKKKVNLEVEDKIRKLLDIYNKENTNHDKQSIADIIFYKVGDLFYISWNFR